VRGRLNNIVAKVLHTFGPSNRVAPPPVFPRPPSRRIETHQTHQTHAGKASQTCTCLCSGMHSSKSGVCVCGKAFHVRSMQSYMSRYIRRQTPCSAKRRSSCLLAVRAGWTKHSRRLARPLLCGRASLATHPFSFPPFIFPLLTTHKTPAKSSVEATSFKFCIELPRKEMRAYFRSRGARWIIKAMQCAPFQARAMQQMRDFSWVLGT